MSEDQANPGGTFFCVIYWPTWPPRSQATLAQGEAGLGRFRIDGLPTGQLLLEVAQAHDQVVSSVTPPVQPTSEGYTILSARWTESSATLSINGKDLPADPLGLEPTFFFQLTEVPVRTPLVADADFALALPSAEAFFFETLRDLEEKLRRNNQYHAIRSAGLLRQLIADGGQSLAVRLASKYMLKLRFAILSRTELPLAAALHWRTWGAFGRKDLRQEQVTLDAFLRLPVLERESGVSSVLDVIKVCANVQGGVHAGPAKGIEQELLMAFDQVSSTSANTPSLSALQDIAVVVLDGMVPLVQAIRKGNG